MAHVYGFNCTEACRNMIINRNSPELLDQETVERLRRSSEEFWLISMQETSKKYGVPIRTLRRWQRDGKMPERKKHGKWLKYPRAEIEQCIFRNRRRSRSEG
jgi:hypothetical protein